MISVRNLHKSYPTRFGRKVVLDGVDFDLQPGDRLGILGRNGAGKSTLVRLVSGAEKPTSGTIERAMSVSWPLAFGGAFQPQLTGIDNIRFITSVYDQDFDRNLAFVEDFAELGPYLREPVRTYSSGMRARLAFAISMIIEFDCFLIDEIGAVGDARFHDRCNHELFDLRGDRAMIIISHDAGYVREHCNRWAILHEGRLSHFDDFEIAYATYKELIGADSRAEPAPVNFADRARMIKSSQHSALSDERFRALAQEGDWARDRQNWSAAAENYAKALALYPYQRSYWTQLGHMQKEQGKFAEAEIAYRTAVGLGEPLADVEEHAMFVIARQGDEEQAASLRVPQPGNAASQPPTKPDLDTLTWLFLGHSIPDPDSALGWMRAHDSLDTLGAALAMEQGSSAQPRLDDEEVRHRQQRTLCLLGEHLPKDASGDDLLRVLIEGDCFRRWPLTRAALAERRHSSPPPDIDRKPLTASH